MLKARSLRVSNLKRMVALGGASLDFAIRFVRGDSVCGSAETLPRSLNGFSQSQVVIYAKAMAVPVLSVLYLFYC